MASIFSSGEPDAIGLLKQDHRKVEDLFKQFEQADDGETRIELAQQICQELTVHALVEEREFYPALLDAFDEDGDDLIKEAEVEHRTLKMLIAEIDGSSDDDRLFEANVKVLKEYVEHHVKEEENEIMPKARSAGLDLDAMGARVQKLKERLMSQVMEAAEGQSVRGKARVRVARPGSRGAAKGASRSAGARKSAARANGSRATSRGNGRGASRANGNASRTSGKGARKSASARKTDGRSARGRAGGGGARAGGARSTGARTGGGRGGNTTSRGGRGASSPR
jgi:hemerythrin superfamily protein